MRNQDLLVQQEPRGLCAGRMLTRSPTSRGRLQGKEESKNSPKNNVRRCKHEQRVRMIDQWRTPSKCDACICSVRSVAGTEVSNTAAVVETVTVTEIWAEAERALLLY